CAPFALTWLHLTDCSAAPTSLSRRARRHDMQRPLFPRRQANPPPKAVKPPKARAKNAEPADQPATAVGYADGNGADRRDREGRHLPAHAHRPRPRGARLVQDAM